MMYMHADKTLIFQDEVYLFPGWNHSRQKQTQTELYANSKLVIKIDRRHKVNRTSKLAHTLNKKLEKG